MMMSIRRMWRPVAGVVLSAVVLSACTTSATTSGQSDTPQSNSGQSSATQPTVPSGPGFTLGLTYIPNVQFSPVYVAEEEGMYYAAGSNLTVRHHGADEGIFTALLAGTEDIVLASGDEALQAAAQGTDLVAVATYYQRPPVSIIVREDSNFQTISSLRGKTIGIPGEYGSSWFGLQAILAHEGMTPADVTVKSIGYTQLAALASGEVDAVVGFSNNEPVRFPAQGVAIRELPVENLPLVSASLITTRERLESDPEQICAIAQGTQAGMGRVAQVPQRAIEATQVRDETLVDGNAVQGARDVLDATIPLFKDGSGTVSARPDLAKWREMLTFFADKIDPSVASIEIDKVVTDQCFQR